MFPNVLFAFLFIPAQAQLNGDFWWLNSKLNSINKVHPSKPIIDAEEFQNDESAKIIFRDDFFNNLKPIADRTSKFTTYKDSGENKIVWPSSEPEKKLDVEIHSNSVKENPEGIKVVWPTTGHMKNHDVEVFVNINDSKEKREEIKITWPTDQHMKNHDIHVVTDKTNTKQNNRSIAFTTIGHMGNHDVLVLTNKTELKDRKDKTSNIQNRFDDIIVFNYPKREKIVTITQPKPNIETTQRPITTQIAIETEIESMSITNAYNFLGATNHKESQNICTYTKRVKCLQLNGFVYDYSRRVPKTSGDEPLVCCILPLQPDINKENLTDNINYPVIASNLNRIKRSDAKESGTLTQREFLLRQKFPPQYQNLKPASTPLTKIVTPPEDDYVDPYWNIKNTKFQTPNNNQAENTKYDYYSYDSDEEYADELPKPGLVGLYSDHAKSPSSWAYASTDTGLTYGGANNDYADVDDDDEYVNTFGYSTIDPRQGSKNQKQKGKPVKLTTTSDEVTYDAQRHTINFQSNPDFHVFQGFKLLNLFRNTSKVHTTTTKNTGVNQNKDILVDEPEDSEEVEEFFEKDQIFNGCGKVLAKAVNDRGQTGEAGSGTHPWMALVVLTKRRNTVLCYATLVHTRAAITVGDCVHGTAPGHISVIAGLWDLNDRSRSKSRVATVHVHPRYKPGGIDNNLAVLYWMQPFKLSTKIQPVCLGEPEIDEECKFFGWGGLDQGIQQQRSRWQRVTVRTCSRVGTKHTRSTSEVFCVSTPRGTVTGIGGPLICEIEGHSTIVGLVVSRENGYTLLPVRDWAVKSENLISGD